MLDKLFGKALTLVVNGEEITFNTLSEFEFALGGRTNVPASKISDLMTLSPEELKREAKSIKAVEKRFVDILSRSIEHPREIGKLVREVDTQVFSNDFDWRAIFKALNQQDEDYDDLRRVAVVKYMQYLRSRQDIIKQTYKIKTRGQGGERREGEVRAAGGERAGTQDARDVFKETSIFESAVLEQALDLGSAAFTRLPKGEAVIVHPQRDSEFEFKLSKHRFVFRNHTPRAIVDDQGAEHPLVGGKTIIGRDSVCNIVVGTGVRDVSRMHLIIEPLDDGAIRFTDLSSHGTFLPRSLVSASTP